ncbi:hypothetical protein D3C84_1113410 [compost metagenome]
MCLGHVGGQQRSNHRLNTKSATALVERFNEHPGLMQLLQKPSALACPEQMLAQCSIETRQAG